MPRGLNQKSIVNLLPGHKTWQGGVIPRALQNFVCSEKKHHVAAGLEMRLDGGDAALCLRPEGVRGGCVKRWEQVVTQNLAEGMICSQQRGKEALGPLISQFESLNAPGGWVL